MTEADQHRLTALLEEEVTSGQTRLKEANLKELKNLCRKSDDLIKEAYQLLQQHLQRDHAEARWSAFLLVKELFERSHTFRELLIDDIQQFLVLVAEIDRGKPLPPPKPVAVRLKEHAVSTLKSWWEKYGSAYKKLDLAFTFLKDTKKIKLSESASAELQIPSAIMSERQTARQIVDKKRIDGVLAEKNESEEEIENLLTEIENLFKIVVPDFENDSVQSSSVQSSDLRHHGFFSNFDKIEIKINLNSSFLKVKKTCENDVMMEKIEENSLLLSRKFLPKMIFWVSVLSKNGAKEEILKNFIDLKQKMENVLRKTAALGIPFTEPSSTRFTREKSQTDSDDDDFEEVPEKEGLELIIPPNKRKEYGLEMISQNAQRIFNEDAPCCSKTLRPETETADANRNSLSSKTQTVDSTRSSLFAKAPVVAFGADLEEWGEAKTTTCPSFQSQFDALHRFWRPPEVSEDFTNQEVTASLSHRSIPFIGKFERVEWSCRAPLTNGQLCSRMDRKNCPFHGKIVARNIFGVAAVAEDRRREAEMKERAEREKVPEWQDPEFLRDIEAQTGRNLKVEKKRKKKKTEGNLSDVKKLKENPRSRLEKIVLDKSTVKRIASEMDQRQKTTVAEKFSHNWNYSFNS